jgi:hypothetical protein
VARVALACRGSSILGLTDKLSTAVELPLLADLIYFFGLFSKLGGIVSLLLGSLNVSKLFSKLGGIVSRLFGIFNVSKLFSKLGGIVSLLLGSFRILDLFSKTCTFIWFAVRPAVC